MTRCQVPVSRGLSIKKKFLEIFRFSFSNITKPLFPPQPQGENLWCGAEKERHRRAKMRQRHLQFLRRGPARLRRTSAPEWLTRRLHLLDTDRRSMAEEFEPEEEEDIASISLEEEEEEEEEELTSSVHSSLYGSNESTSASSGTSTADVTSSSSNNVTSSSSNDVTSSSSNDVTSESSYRSATVGEEEEPPPRVVVVAEKSSFEKKLEFIDGGGVGATLSETIVRA